MYYRWSPAQDILLKLDLYLAGGFLGATSGSPEVGIRRGNGDWWTGAVFTSTPTFLGMTEFDSTNNPGLYTFLFPNSTIGADDTYVVEFRNTSPPGEIGRSSELHVVTSELFIPAGSPVVPVGPDTVLGRLIALDDPSGTANLANADAVWDEPLAGHLTPGSTGAALASCTALTVGSRQVTIHVDDNTVSPIQGVQVDIYDITNTFFIGRVFTDVNGDATIAIDDGTYNLRMFANGFSFTVPESMVVTMDETFTFMGTITTNIFTPSAPNLCVIFGTILDAGGDPIPGACVQARAVTPQVVGGAQYGEILEETVTNQNGFFQIELVRNLTVRFIVEDTDFNFQRTVPDLPSQDITTWT